MPTMTIGRMNMTGEPDGKVYYAFTQGSPNRYRVIGDTVEDQLATMQRMSNQMIADQAGFTADLGEYVELGEMDVETVYTELYGITDSMLMDGEIVYVVEEAGEVLAEFIMDVGMALMEFLV